MFTNTTPYLTLARLKAMYPDLFYPQDWYDTEEFAHRPVPLGNISVDIELDRQYDPVTGTGGDPTAAMCAFFWVSRVHRFGVDTFWSRHYVWTSDKDKDGNMVYVGGHALGQKFGFQVHRHLTNINAIEVGYRLDKT